MFLLKVVVLGNYKSSELEMYVGVYNFLTFIKIVC